MGRRVGTVGILALGAVLLVVAGAVAFPDVPNDHPYAAAVDELSGREIINGFPDGTFKPDQGVIRQQFAKMIVLTLGLPVTEDDVAPFIDVPSSGPSTLYPDNYIAVAAENAVTNGTGGGRFSPGDPITRAQVITMVVRAADRLLPGVLDDPPGSFVGTLGSFSPVHAENARVAEFNGLLSGLQGFGVSWDPWAGATRGEVAWLLYRLLLLSGPTTSTSGDTTSSTSAGTTSTSASTTSTTSSSTTSTTLQEFEVEMEGTSFVPSTITVPVGATVVWKNRSNLTHNVTADDGTFASPDLGADGEFSFTFTQAGTFAYRCTLHPGMNGTVVVEWARARWWSSRRPLHGGGRVGVLDGGPGDDILIQD